MSEPEAVDDVISEQVSGVHRVNRASQTLRSVDPDAAVTAFASSIEQLRLALVSAPGESIVEQLDELDRCSIPVKSLLKDYIETLSQRDSSDDRRRR